MLVERFDTGPGNFDIEFNYNQIRWETGDASGGSGGFGGSSARVGYANGTGAPGTFFELSGSAVNGAFLDSNSNTGLIHNSLNSSVLGRYVFFAREGIVIPENEPPVANPGGPYTVPEGGTVTLNGSGSSDSDGTIVSYEWDFDYDGTFQADTSGVSPTFSAAGISGPATQTVALRVTDNDGDANIATTTVNVTNVAPVASIISGPSSADEGTAVTFVGSFTDQGTIDSHAQQWSVVASNGQVVAPLTIPDTGVSSGGSGGSSFSFTPVDNGTYTITYTVTDDDGGVSTDTFGLTVHNVAPAFADVAVTSDINENDFAVLSGRIVDPGALDTFTLTIDWGDPLSPGDQVVSLGMTSISSGGIAWDPVSREFSVEYQYLDDVPSGTPSAIYSVTVTIVDDDGIPAGAGSVLFTTHQDGMRLGTIDLATGVGTDIGSFGTTQTWAATFDTDGTLYTLFAGFSGNARLATVDTSSGALTPVGSGVGTNMISLAVAADGKLYGVGYIDGVLYEISKTTGTATPVGSTGISNVMDLAFDSSGTLHATVGNRIWTVDTVTGSASLLGTVGGVAFGSLMGMSFDGNDTLYATAYISNAPLYTVDLGTMTATVVGSTGFHAPHGGSILAGPAAPDTATVEVTVHNVAPALSLDPVADIDENGIATLSGTITDPGTLDTFTLDVDWGDPISPGNVESIDLNNPPAHVTWDPLTRQFSITHQYLDAGPSGTASHDYTVTVTVTDDDTGVGSASASITVHNVAPTITGLTSGAEHCGDAHEDGSITLELTFEDVGSIDVHTVVIDWGDGNNETHVLTVGDRSLSVTYQYAVGGVYTIGVTVSDDDLGSASSSVLAAMSGVGLHNGVLQIIGTAGADHVTLNQTGNGTLKVHASFIQEHLLGQTRDFNLADVERILIVMCGGDDHVNISSRVTLDAIIDVGSGNNHVNGGGGSNLIFGNGGDNHFNGGSSRDILIGGAGFDRLVGGPGRDLLSGGILTDENGTAVSAIHHEGALLALQAAYKAASDSQIDTWREDGADAFFADFGLVLIDDGDRDVLTGSADDDWVVLFGDDLHTDASGNGKAKGKK